MDDVMYTRFYKLSKRPFQNAPDPQFLYLSKKHREVLASLVYGIHSEKGFILVLGNVGTGKTTLIRSVLETIRPCFLVFHITTPCCTSMEIMQYLAEKLDIKEPRQSKFALMNSLENAIKNLHTEGKQIVLIIDEAQHLSEESLEEIRLLSNIETPTQKLVQIVMVAQSELYKTLNKDSLKQLRQRIVIYRHLEPLDKRETKEYIHHRLRVAGQDSVLFNNKALNHIWEKSQGIPRVINQLCDNALLIGYALKAPIITSKIVKEVIEDMERVPPVFKKPPSFLGAGFKWAATVVVLASLLTYAAKNSEMGETLYNLVRSPPTTYADVSRATSISRPMPGKKMLMPVPSSMENSTTPPPESPTYDGEQSVPPSEAVDEFTFSNPELPRIKHTSQNASPSAMKTGHLPEASDPRADDMAPVEITGSQVSPVLQQPATPSSIMDIHTQDAQNLKWQVAPNEYLLKIARKKYGVVNDTILDLIYMANPSLKSLDRIFPGQELILPKIKKSDLLLRDTSGQYLIYYGSFYSADTAQQLITRLKESEHRAFFISHMQGDLTVYRIYLGLFQNREEAQRALETVDFDHLPFKNTQG